MRLVVFLAALTAAASARGADVVVSVRTAAGLPVANAVVTLYPIGKTAPPSQPHFDWPMRMAQHNKTFDPFVLIAPVGATVAFPNLDKFRHHVYSFSPAHPFELKLYGQDDTRSVRFDKVGVVALGCNIHDSMIAFIKVVDTPFAAKTGENGDATIHDAPAATLTLHVWHPYMKSPGNEQVKVISAINGDIHELINIELRPPPKMSSMY